MIVALLLAAQLMLPNTTLTPGVLRPLSLKIICNTKWGVDHRYVNTRMKKQVAAAYGIPWADHRLYEFDHLVPRSLGGADKVANLWPQLWAEAHVKDALEVRLGKLVCNLTLSLAEAQAAIRSDWVYANRKWPRQPQK